MFITRLRNMAREKQEVKWYTQFSFRLDSSPL
jgi:hypothetical protein